MARSDLLLSLVRAGSTGDKTLFRRSVEAIVSEERAKQHHVLADQLSEYLQVNGASSIDLSSRSDERLQSLFYSLTPNRSLDELVLPVTVCQSVRELIEEHERRELLRAYNLEPRHRVLLVGPPGNGKTSLAESIAESLLVPLIVVRYDGLIGSYLGETASRLRRLFDWVRTQRCVLFFDEFDVIGKERGDNHEAGEMKRVVSSLLLQIDDLPSHVVVVTATNHAELLDRAVWRRFQLRLSLPAPTTQQREEWLQKFEKRLNKKFGVPIKTIAEHFENASFAEMEDFCLDIQRRHILTLPNSNLKKIVMERLQQWDARFQLASSDGE